MLAESTLLFAGPANPALARAVAAELEVPLAPCEFRRFPDGEVSVRIDTSVRGRHVLLVQGTAPPVNDHLMELLAFGDACRRASAASFTAVIPYFGYARSDRRQGQRVPVTASMVAGLMEAVGVQQVLTLDVHSPQVEGFFRIPVENLSAMETMCEVLERRAAPDTVVVSPDLGAAKLATLYGKRLGLPVAVVHKLRQSATEVSGAGISGDVRGKRCIIVDDMITTGATVANAARALAAAGASGEPVVAATHGVLTDDAWERLSSAGVRELVLTDSVTLAPREQPSTSVVSVAPLLAQAIAHAARERMPEPAGLFGSG